MSLRTFEMNKLSVKPGFLFWRMPISEQTWVSAGGARGKNCAHHPWLLTGTWSHRLGMLPPPMSQCQGRNVCRNRLESSEVSIWLGKVSKPGVWAMDKNRG